MSSLRIPTGPLAEHLAALELAAPSASGSLTLWPLRLHDGAPPPKCPDHLPLAAALAQGLVLVDEVSEGGSVPHVRVTNRSELAVLFLFGEEIRGAKQNRVANASFLVAPKSAVVLDVSCVEAGRWHRRPGSRFEAADAVLASSVRRKMAGKVAAARSRGLGFDADQAEVWGEIEVRIGHAGAASRTGAYADYRASRASEVDAIGAAFAPNPGQVGFVAAIGGAIAGVELLGRSEVFAASHGALVRGYAIDAVDAALLRARDGGDGFDAPEPFLAAVARAGVRAGASLGLGEDLRIEGGGVVGCALACEGIVHLSAFPGPAPRPRPPRPTF
jgi:ARG/rhodanese/phosphatase superfamily protein